MAGKNNEKIPEFPDPEEPTMIIYENPEKTHRRSLGAGKYMPRTSDRILISGMPGSGKRVLILNIVNRINPKFIKAIHIVHSDPNTIEYDCLSALGKPIYLYSPEDMPTLENIERPDPPKKTEGSDSDNTDTEEEDTDGTEEACNDEENTKEKQGGIDSIIIIDEVPAHEMGRVGKGRMERIVNHLATHKNCLVLCSIQNLTNLPAMCRRGFNCYALYKQADAQCNHMAAHRAGIGPDMLMDLFELCKDKHDFIFIDLDRSIDDPYRYRLNWFSPIQIESNENPS